MTAWRAATASEIDARKRALATVTRLDIPTGHRILGSGLAADPGLPDVSLIRGDSVRPEPISWLWDGWLATGKFHVLAGQPGTGKTTIALAFAATVTSGGSWPDGTMAAAGNVLIWSGEDDATDVLVPRLRAMGADMARVYFVGPVRNGTETRPFDPATDLPALAYKLGSIGGAALLIVDPIVSAVSGDSHKNAETRRSLQPLVNLASTSKCAVLGISHFTKGTSGREPVERVTGSLAFAALARLVLVAAKLPDDRAAHEPARVIARAKSNISPDSGGFGYDVEYDELDGYPGVWASRVVWGGAIDGSARELLAQAEQVEEDGGTENAREFLRYLLSTGPMKASDVFRDGEAHGYSKRQMQRARSAIGARIEKAGMQGGWEWSLPKMPLAPEDAEDTEQNCLAPSAPSAAAQAYRRVRG